MADQGYSRTLTFVVNDKQIKRATDRLFQSLDRIEKKLDIIAGKGARSGFKRVEKQIDGAIVKVNNLSSALVKSQAKFTGLKYSFDIFAGVSLILSKVKQEFLDGITGVKAFQAEIERVNGTIGRTFLMLDPKKSVKLGGTFRDLIKYTSFQGGGPGSPYRRNELMGAGRTGMFPTRYFADGSERLGGYDFIPFSSRNPEKGRRRGTWQEDLRRRMDIRRQALERSGTGFGAFSRDVDFNQAFSRERGTKYGTGGSAIEKSIQRHYRKEKLKNKEIRDLKARQLRLDRAQNRALRERVGITEKIAKKTKASTDAKGKGLFQGGVKGALGSGLIGGGFPLLFGQGIPGALGGGIGGTLGGAIGGQFGFSLSIVGTVIATEIQKAIEFRKAIDKVNEGIKNTGGTSLFTAQSITKLSKELNITKEETLEAVKAFKAFEASQRMVLIRTFGSESSFSSFAQISQGANSLISQLQPMMASGDISLKEAKSVLDVLGTKGFSSAQGYLEELKFADQLDKKLMAIKVTEDDRSKAKAAFMQFHYQDQDGMIRSLGILEKMTKEEQKKFTVMFNATYFRDQRRATEEARFNDEIGNAKQLLDYQRQVTEQMEIQMMVQAPADQLRKLMDPARQVIALSQEIGASFSQSFKGIIKGTMSVQEAFANMFGRIADHFLDMAAQMAAAQLQKGFLSMFSNLFTFKTGDIPVDGLRTGSKFADGGRPPKGRVSLVGERGPELFVPDSAGTIIPNHAMGGANIVVNVDASGSAVEGNGGQAEELGSMLAAAVQAELVNQQRPGGLLAGTR